MNSVDLLPMAQHQESKWRSNYCKTNKEIRMSIVLMLNRWILVQPNSQIQIQVAIKFYHLWWMQHLWKILQRIPLPLPMNQWDKNLPMKIKLVVVLFRQLTKTINPPLMRRRWCWMVRIHKVKSFIIKKDFQLVLSIKMQWYHKESVISHKNKWTSILLQLVIPPISPWWAILCLKIKTMKHSKMTVFTQDRKLSSKR